MISIQFVAQNIATKEVTKSSVLYYKELDYTTKALMESQRVKLVLSLPNHRIMVLVANEETK
jgi:hypothetical protein